MALDWRAWLAFINPLRAFNPRNLRSITMDPLSIPPSETPGNPLEWLIGLPATIDTLRRSTESCAAELSEVRLKASSADQRIQALENRVAQLEAANGQTGTAATPIHAALPPGYVLRVIPADLPTGAGELFRADRLNLVPVPQAGPGQVIVAVQLQAS